MKPVPQLPVCDLSINMYLQRATYVTPVKKGPDILSL